MLVASKGRIIEHKKIMKNKYANKRSRSRKETGRQERQTTQSKQRLATMALQPWVPPGNSANGQARLASLY
jgi:hypothetical protein